MAAPVALGMMKWKWLIQGVDSCVSLMRVKFVGWRMDALSRQTRQTEKHHTLGDKERAKASFLLRVGDDLFCVVYWKVAMPI